MKARERPYPGDGKPLNDIYWATDAQHVDALHAVDGHANDPQERARFADMLGFDTPAMRQRYERGVVERRARKADHGLL